MACAHEDGRSLPPVGFAATDVVGLARYVRLACGEEVRAVIDSTNGLLDGPLRHLGLTVLRADPWDLPPRPLLGSASALTLAQRAHKPGARALPETDTANGTLKGRIEEHLRAVGSSAAYEAELVEQGKCFGGGSQTSRRVALTFDDGPSEPYTGQVLDILRDYGAVATFFCVGLHVSAAPALVARMRTEGHSVANHTWSHPYLPDLSQTELLRQFEATGNAVAAVTGERPVLVRPPYGSRTPDTLRWTEEAGLTTVLWSRDTCDWALGGISGIVSRALDTTGAEGDAVVLMHDGGGDRSQTVAALPLIIESLLATGHDLVSIDEMVSQLVGVR
ncbi:polysaccharide deacetylase family protein [Streptomyces sp. NPDC048248]|uniref:polysaccharide deacetylase family protein n=1 Tax=Streptomyces sp. NPDC048248 TaxID=3365523 RepID=UPI00371D658D